MRIHPVTHHVHGKGNDIHISSSFSIAKQSTLHPVCTGQHTKLRVTDAAAPVIVGMHA